MSYVVLNKGLPIIKHNKTAMTEDEWLELQYENYLVTQANTISCYEDTIEHELEYTLA